MAESALSLGWTDFKEEVGFFLKYGRDTWTAAQEAEIEGIVHGGVRRVYYPPAIGEGKERTVGYEWSWLRPSTTLAQTASSPDGGPSSNRPGGKPGWARPRRAG